MENQKKSDDDSSFKLSGTGTTSKIFNTHESTLCATDSSLFLDNTSKIRIHAKLSNISVQNSTHVNVNGSKHEIFADKLTNSSIFGEENNIATRDTDDFVISGCKNICELTNEANPSVFGDGNQVMAARNFDLVVSGFINRVVAEDNRALNIRGSMNTIVAHKTQNIKVEGNWNQVSARDTAICHEIGRFNTVVGKIPENQVYFSGTPTNCCSYGGTTFKSVTPKTFVPDKENSQNEVMSPSPNLNLVSDTGLGVENNLKLVPFRVVVPQLSIYYIDRASIRKNVYTLGIFYFQVNSLQKPLPNGGSSPSSQIVVQIYTETLDEGSFDWAISKNGKYALVSGSKNGGMQTLRLVGNQVSPMSGCEPPQKNMFVIELDPEVEIEETIEAGVDWSSYSAVYTSESE